MFSIRRPKDVAWKLRELGVFESLSLVRLVVRILQKRKG